MVPSLQGVFSLKERSSLETWDRLPAASGGLDTCSSMSLDEVEAELPSGLIILGIVANLCIGFEKDVLGEDCRCGLLVSILLHFAA